MVKLLNYALYFLTIFGLLAWFFKEASPKSEKIKLLSRRCPCTRLAEAGLLTKMLNYTSVVVFVYNGLYMKFYDFNYENIIQLILASLLVFLGYKVQKDDIYDRD